VENIEFLFATLKNMRTFGKVSGNRRLLKAVAQAEQTAMIEVTGVDPEGKKINFSQIWRCTILHPAHVANENQPRSSGHHNLSLCHSVG
jgi:hypothetical protein